MSSRFRYSSMLFVPLCSWGLEDILSWKCLSFGSHGASYQSITWKTCSKRVTRLSHARDGRICQSRRTVSMKLLTLVAIPDQRYQLRSAASVNSKGGVDPMVKAFYCSSFWLFFYPSNPVGAAVNHSASQNKIDCWPGSWRCVLGLKRHRRLGTHRIHEITLMACPNPTMW